MIIPDEFYVEVYDKMGNRQFGKSWDEQLKSWGNSEEDIRKMKIDCIKHSLEFDIEGIEIYKALNEKCGGKNIL